MNRIALELTPEELELIADACDDLARRIYPWNKPNARACAAIASKAAECLRINDQTETGAEEKKSVDNPRHPVR